MLSAVAGWWLFLTVLVVWSYIQRVRDAKEEPLTPEQIEECRRLEEGLPQKHWRCRRDYFIALPFIIAFILFLLPCYVYGWLLEHRDPYDTHKA
jgi:hypothetical protein